MGSTVSKAIPKEIKPIVAPAAAIGAAVLGAPYLAPHIGATAAGATAAAGGSVLGQSAVSGKLTADPLQTGLAAVGGGIAGYMGNLTPAGAGIGVGVGEGITVGGAETSIGLGGGELPTLGGLEAEISLGSGLGLGAPAGMGSSLGDVVAPSLLQAAPSSLSRYGVPLALGAAAPTLLNAVAPNFLSKWGMPLGLAATTIGSQVYGAKEEEKMMENLYSQQRGAVAQTRQDQLGDIADAQTRATDVWQETAFPAKEKIDAAKYASIAEINQRSQMAQRNLMSNLAARGITGGGLARQSAYEQEMDRQRQIAQLSSQLTQFQHTPYVPPPIMTNYPNMPTVMQQPYTTAGQRIASTAEGLAGTVGGLWGYNQLKNYDWV